MSFLEEVFVNDHTDDIPPSAEVQEWAARQASSKRERTGDPLWASVLVILVGLAGIGFGTFAIALGLLQLGVLS